MENFKKKKKKLTFSSRRTTNKVKPGLEEGYEPPN
jgi:hypothetical protein